MFMSELHIIIFLPVIAGLLLFAVPEKLHKLKAAVSVAVAIVTLFYSFDLYLGPAGMVNLLSGEPLFQQGTLAYACLHQAGSFLNMNIDNLAKLIVLFIGFFTLIVSVYSIGYLFPKNRPRQYYPYFLITAGCSNGAVLADHMLLFIFFWGILGLTLYKLIKGHTSISASTAKKTFILIGASDGIMILGLAFIMHLGFPLSISAMSIPTTSVIGVVAFLCLVIGAFTKAGAFPFHTWVPDYASYAPASSSVFLPASLDKLLGIYFLARLFNQMFVLNEYLTLLMIIIGVATIILGVMMALAQKNYKRLLGYHAVSQVGYMVVGFALGTPLGIAGGLFHMINNALYKSGLFMAAGHVERHTGKHMLDELGGLSKVMPITFFSVLVFSMSISGIPPFNGFASKWLIYQGIIDFGGGSGVANQLWIVWLALAIIGSALTLASFIKFIAGIFLGHTKSMYRSVKRKNMLLCIPQAIIAIVCIVFGVFATNWVIPKIIQNVSGEFLYIGMWESSAVSLLILLSILLGILFYYLMTGMKFRTDEAFMLGESTEHKTNFPAGEYYKTITDHKLLRVFYKGAEKKYFDIYDVFREGVLGFSKVLSKLHAGVLPVYLIWILAGLLIMLFIFM